MLEIEKVSENSELKVVRLSFLRGIKHVFMGVPITTKFLTVPWSSIRTPFFPFANSFLMGFLMVLTLIEISTHGFYLPGGEYFNLAIIVNITLGFLLGIFINLIQLIWFMLILKFYKIISRMPVKVGIAAERLLYVTSVYQPLIFAFLLLAILKGPVISGTFSYCLLIVAAVVGAVRLLAVFQGMRRETEGSLIFSLLSIIFCIEIWYPLSLYLRG